MNKNNQEYKNNYNKEHYKTISFRLSYDKDAYMLEWLDIKYPIKKYLYQLIKEDMERVSNGKD